MFTAEYEILVRNRRTQLLREAEHERLLTEVKQQKTTRTSSRWAVWLGCSLVKWGKKLDAAHKEPALLYRHHES